jgi:hypothetical protein
MNPNNFLAANIYWLLALKIANGIICIETSFPKIVSGYATEQ